MFIANTATRYLCAFVALIIFAQGFACGQTCSEMNMTFVNNTGYTLYRTQGSGPDSINAGDTGTYQGCSGDYNGANYTDTVTYTADTEYNSNEPFTVTFYINYDPCFTDNCSNVNGSSSVEYDPAGMGSAGSVSNGNSGGCVSESCWEDLCYPDPPSSQHSGSVTLTMDQPKAVAIKIQLPDVSGTDKADTVAGQTFLQQVYNNLNANLMAKFDVSDSDPTDESDNTLNFNVLCGSDACKNIGN